ncbi:rhomboid family intramembrane serine protease [Methylogaea oryzae]|uniref:rhomboid family intramembrane serine protease n=1 Tax=Methylogaea oryzae TaxID=1295382 RepID=UPI0020D199C1|nr:rhomboid family intramembrane serine protease [Methylogaea oryzae]
MLPLRDLNPTIHTPVATWGVIGLNALAWVFIQGMGMDAPMAESLCRYADSRGPVRHGAVGRRHSGDGKPGLHPGKLPSFAHLAEPYVHARRWFHIITNMWFLYIFGDNVEDAMGPVRFIVFYLLCGLAAAVTQLMADSNALIPMVGASGAIGGVLGAYARLYPQVRVVTLVPIGFYFTQLELPAIAMLGYWFFLQLAGGIPALAGAGGGVAFWAHIGGFLAGLVLVGLLRRPDEA